MGRLAIKGHATRFKEVKQILRQLGGQCSGYACSGNKFYYYVNRHDNIEGVTALPDDYWNIFTLEEFEKEFPYKVGEVVTYFDRNNKPIQLLIQKIRWNPTRHGGTVEYVLQNGVITTGENLKPMKQKELKDYLKPGYVVEYDDGVRYILTQDVHGNVFGVEIHNDQYWATLKDLSRIVAVYQITSPSNLHYRALFDSSTKKVWEKPTEVELTMQEIADKFGIDVNQLKIKK